MLSASLTRSAIEDHNDLLYTPSPMDESYHELLANARRSRDKSFPAQLSRALVHCFHKILIFIMVVLFRIRLLAGKVKNAIKRALLTPLDWILCIVFSIWARNRRSTSSTHLNLQAVRTAFWEGDSLVVGVGMRTFFIKRKIVEKDKGEEQVPEIASTCTPPPITPRTAFKLKTAAADPRPRRRRCLNRRWRKRATVNISALSPAAPVTAATIEATLKKHKKLGERFKRIQEKYREKHSSRGIAAYIKLLWVEIRIY